ncbi:MAG TPA: hypothetical protein PLG70_09080 [Ottowia sp.]|nr:hypothetical protein [Ottowia sp.]
MATTLDERRQKPTPRPAAAMDLGMVDGAAQLNLTRPGAMSPDAPKPVPTQPAPQFDRTNAGPMLRQPPAPVPPAPAVDLNQQRMANQSAMYVQGAQAAAAARPPSPVQQMVDSPMSAPVRNSINAAVANPQPTLGAAIDTSPRLFDPATARPSATAGLVSVANAATAQPAAAAPAQPGEYSRQMGNVAQFFGDAVKTLVSAPGYGMSKDNPTAAPAIPPAPNYGNDGRRTPMAAASPSGPRGTNEAQAKNPAADQGQVPGAAKPMPQGAQPEVGPPDGYTNTRVDGVYRKGNAFTDEAGTRDTAFQNRGAITPQNQNAAEQLAANYNSNQQALARLQANNAAAQPAPAAAPRQFDRAASIRALSDLRSPEAIALRNLRIDAQEEARDSARMGRAGRGNNAAGQAYAALVGELTTGTRQGQTAEMQDATNRYTADAREAGATQRALMGEEGATRRAGMTNEVQQGELGLKREAQNITRERDQRLRKAEDDFQNETDPAKREAKARTLQALMGKGDGTPAGKDRYITMGGGQAPGPEGRIITLPQEVFDTVTGQRVGAAKGGTGDIATDPMALAIKNDTKLTREQKAAQLQQLGY